MTVGKTLSQEYDLIILGAGCAGLACAIEAADLGGRVMILEKMSHPAGNILFAGGGIAAAGTRFQEAQGIHDDAESFYTDLMKVSLQRADQELTRTFARNSADAIHWLSDTVGVQWSPIVKRPAPTPSRTHEVTGPHRPGGAQLSRELLAAAEKRNIQLLYKTNVLELIGNASCGVQGVRVQTETEVRDFGVRGGVVLATGGFHANREMVSEYIGNWASLMPYRGSHASTGENITLSRPFGAKFVNMDQFHGGPIHGPTKANPSGTVNAGICVTPGGKRYVDEGWSYVRIGLETARKSDDNHAFVILDEEAKKSHQVMSRFERYQRAKAPIYEHETIEGLACEAGIGIEELVRTVKEYNAAVLANRTGDLVPPNTRKLARPIQTPKFYAIPFRGGMTATFGGPLINAKAQVISTEDGIIPGLYAAGNAAGGLLYGDYIVGSQLGAAIVFGRIAAADGCARALRSL